MCSSEQVVVINVINVLSSNICLSEVNMKTSLVSLYSAFFVV